MKYGNYEFKDYIVRALNDLKFKSLTDIQTRVIEEVKINKNILAKSKTGSGKTHAFLIPIFEALDEDDKKVQATILAPTKELALQIYKMAQHIASFSGKEIIIKNYSAGTDREREIAKLNNTQPQIVIGTPGKIKDLAVDSNALKIYTSKFFVIDEVDMTLDSGFLDEVDVICSVIKDAKYMFFSATLEDKIKPFIQKYMTNVNFIDINNTFETKISHIWIPLKHRERIDRLVELLGNINPYLCLIFVNRKEDVNDLVQRLDHEGYFVGSMHGDLSTRERKRMLIDANNLKYQYIVCTDLAARGIDIEGVSHIINYDLPRDYEFYLHRSGRTGRMYKDGIVYSFYEELDDEYLDNLNKKGVTPEYYELKKGELTEFKGRNTRAQRVRPTTNYEAEASKFVPKPKKVKPGYKKKRQAQIDDIAARLKKNDGVKKKRYGVNRNKSKKGTKTGR